jgi:peptidoglycan/xylan/chitin deacetylase (PgdA/CDA1 family)
MEIKTFLKSIFTKKPAKGVVLMYHRIADVSSDVWELAVSPANFEEQLQVLKRYNVISLDKLNDLFINQKNMESNVSITFDDGYRDNYTEAKPKLEKHNTPATFFITTGFIGSEIEFWWDALQRICLETANLPSNLEIYAPVNSSWQIGFEDHETSPPELYLQLCEIFKKLPGQEHQAIITYLESWSSNYTKRATYLQMNEEELLALHTNRLFTLGAHTKTHPFLPNFSYKYQEDEINNGINTLERLTKSKVKYFAFPHGGCNEDTIKILDKTAIQLAFTTNPDGLTNSTYKLTIPRFQVKNWNGKEFEQHLMNWLSNKK